MIPPRGVCGWTFISYSHSIPFHKTFSISHCVCSLIIVIHAHIYVCVLLCLPFIVPYRVTSPELYTMPTLLSSLIPIPRCHFLIPSFAPLTSIIPQARIDVAAAVKAGILPKGYQPRDGVKSIDTRKDQSPHSTPQRGYTINELCHSLFKTNNRMICSSTCPTGMFPMGYRYHLPPYFILLSSPLSIS